MNSVIKCLLFAKTGTQAVPNLKLFNCDLLQNKKKIIALFFCGMKALWLVVFPLPKVQVDPHQPLLNGINEFRRL